MSLISCSVCQNPCSSEALSCPKCGHPSDKSVGRSSSTPMSRTDSNTWKYLSIGMGLLIIFGLGIFFVLKNNTDGSANTSNKSGSTLTTNPFEGQSPNTTSPEQLGNLGIEVGNLFKSGDVKPVARTRFLLLTKDFESILQESNYLSELKPKMLEVLTTIRSGPKGNTKLFAMFHKYSSNLDNPQEGVVTTGVAVVQGLNATKPYVAGEVTTDFQGKAQFKNIKPGTYYIFGYNLIGTTVSIWNLKTDVNDGENRVILDSKNAEVVEN